MPLLDHFHPPLKNQRHWEGFHGRWAAAIADALNEDLLPPEYFAEFQVQVGARVEIDVATFEGVDMPNGEGVAALATERWAPPKPQFVAPGVFPDQVEVQVFNTRGGPELVVAVELISPANKDRPLARRMFAAKAAGYLQMGIGLIIVDIVTGRRANLHDELVELLDWDQDYRLGPKDPLYAVAYRPLTMDDKEQVEIWHEALAVGEQLPTMPLALRGEGFVPVDLEATYMETKLRSRLG